MPRIKLFKGLESNLEGLENQINAWLAQPGIHTRITSTLGQPQHVSSDVFLVFLYEKS